MQAELPRTSLNGSALVGLLVQLALVDRPPASPPLVEGLERWLSWKEAIPLAAALQAAPPDDVPALRGRNPADAPAVSGREPTAAAKPAADAVAVDFACVRDALAREIADDATTAREDGASFVPFRRRHFALQQVMAAAVGPLRAQARAAVARRAPAGRRLAALDAVMADALAAREQALLGLMPVLLERHFTRLRQAAAPAAPVTGSPAQPPAQSLAGPRPRPPAIPDTPWLAVFRADMQRLLLAELDLRLQPALGLLDTLQAAPGAAHETS